MKLSQPVIELMPCPASIFDYLFNLVTALDWENTDLLTKEEAFYDQSFRYEAVTDYFNEKSYYYSNLPPRADLRDGLRVYTDFLLSELFTRHSIFRCQVVCLKPGQNVYPHIDPRYYHAYGHRIHLPMTVNNNSFHVHFDPAANYDITLSKMTDRIITDFDNITPHSAFNYGTAPRIHIICDVVENSIIEKLSNALAGNPNATNPKTIDDYYLHVSNIERRYGVGYKDLKPFYLEKMSQYE